MQNKDFTSFNWRSSYEGSALLLFFIWPLAALYFSFRDYKQDWSKNILWLFCIFFGLTFIIAEEGGADSARYALALNEYAHSDLSLSDLWSSFYSVSSRYVDIASPLIIFLVSRISNNPKILFTVFGLIFGFFYSKNIWYILEHIKGNISIIVFLFILTFSLFNPIWNINGFRMYAAAQIFLFGTLPYLLEGNRKKLFWSGISVFFHFSFVFPLASIVLFLFFRNRIHIYMVFFVLTSFIKEINLQSVQSALSFLPDVFQSRLMGYTNPEYAEAISMFRQSVNWYIIFSSKGIGWVTYIMTLFVYFFGRKFLKNRHDLMTLFCYSLLLYGLSNILSHIPSGYRFLTVANSFMFGFFILFISAFPKIKGLPIAVSISSPMLLLFCIVSIRIGMDYFGFITIIGNPFLASFNIESIPLITQIKQLIF